MPRRRKRGRPRTGCQPVVPVRLAAKQLKKITKLAELKGVNRSTVLRELIDIGLESGQVLLLLRRPDTKGRTEVDRVIRVVAANERVKVTQSAVMCAPSNSKSIFATTSRHFWQPGARTIRFSCPRAPRRSSVTFQTLTCISLTPATLRSRRTVTRSLRQSAIS